MDNKQLYKITLTREQLMLISQCVEDISRFAAGDIDLQHTTDTLINDMDGAETLGIRSFIINNSRAIRRRLFPDLGDYEHIGYDGGSKDKINRKRLIGNTYQIYRSILHQLAIDENWNNVYSNITLPSGDMGTIKVERVDDERESKGSSPTPIRRRRKTSGVSIWMWMILCINIITDNENKKDRMIIAYPSLIM